VHILFNVADEYNMFVIFLMSYGVPSLHTSLLYSTYCTYCAYCTQLGSRLGSKLVLWVQTWAQNPLWLLIVGMKLVVVQGYQRACCSVSSAALRSISAHTLST